MHWSKSTAIFLHCVSVLLYGIVHFFSIKQLHKVIKLTTTLSNYFSKDAANPNVEETNCNVFNKVICRVLKQGTPDNNTLCCILFYFFYEKYTLRNMATTIQYGVIPTRGEKETIVEGRQKTHFSRSPRLPG